MSGIALLCDFSGSPVDRVRLAAMMRSLSHRGPDGSREVLLGGVGIGHHRFWTTPEEPGEEQPVHLPGAELHLALDGRIDNREDLLDALDVADSDRRGLTDALLFLLAFERWREEAFRRVVGPFAVAVFDERSRRVVLGRDALGDRTLFYRHEGSRLAAASEQAALLVDSSVSKDLDESRLACLFALEEPVPGATYFRHVREVPAAHYLTFDGRGPRLTRYWTPSAAPGPRRRSDGEWAAAFRACLDEAVKCRLRSRSRSAVLLSGGLDSAPMTALAARHVAPSRLLAVSWVFDELTACDERQYVDPVARLYDLESVHVPCDGAVPLRDVERLPFNPNIPSDTPYRWLSEWGYRAGRDAGATTLLLGSMGDDLYVDAGDWLYSLLFGGQWREGWSDLSASAGEQGWSAAVKRWVIRPWIPHGVWNWRRRRRRSWLTPYAASLLPPNEETMPPLAPGPGRRGQHRAVMGAANAHGLSSEIWHASRLGVDLRYPFRDRRLVELALGVPSHLLLRWNETRPILRRAFAGLLPEGVILRKDKVGFRPLFDRALAGPEGDLLWRLVRRPDAAWRRFVRAERVSGLGEVGQRDGLDMLILWHCAHLELWGDRMLEWKL